MPIRLRCHSVLYECVDTLTVSHFDSSPSVKTTARRKIHNSNSGTSQVAISRNFTTWQNTADLDTTPSRVSFAPHILHFSFYRHSRKLHPFKSVHEYTEFFKGTNILKNLNSGLLLIFCSKQRFFILQL